MSKKYIPVLVCSSGKTEKDFLSRKLLYNGQSYKFVAAPNEVHQDGVIFQKPDDKIPGEDRTWRDLVKDQNHPDLVPAYELYRPSMCLDIYKNLYHEFGNRFYIFSAGWGIIRADFKIPGYDITYSTDPDIPEYAKRKKDDEGWWDINHLTVDALKFETDSEVILFAGADYVFPFCDMAKSIFCPKKILYKDAKVLEDQLAFIKERNFIFEPSTTPLCRNWFYKAAEEFLADFIKANPVKPNSNITHREAFLYFGFQSPPKDQKELHWAYKEKIHNSGDKKGKEINDMYIKTLEYFNAALPHK
jgi:hypothetical protein